MKKLFYFLLFLTTCFCAKAQNTRLGLQAGLSISGYTYELNPIPGYAGDMERSKPGFTMGVVVDIPVENKFSIQPALNYVQKGTRNEYRMWRGSKGELNIHCLELPINFFYNTHGESESFFVGAGPSFTFHVSGTTKYYDGSEEDIDIGSNADSDDIKSMDYGANFLAGCRWPIGLFFSVGYNMGLTNLFPDDYGRSLKDTYFSIRIGFMFGGRK